MTTMSKLLLDARSGAAAAGEIAANADLQLRNAAYVSADDAAAWAKKRPSQGHLTALLDLPDAARLDLGSWIKALQPDVVELRTPAWSAAGMTAVGWPAGYDALVKALADLQKAGVAVRLALHVSALTVAELTPERLATLQGAAGGGKLNLALRPVLGEHAPALAAVARAVNLLVRSGAKLTASKLWPSCALPEGVDGEATFASERAAAKQAYTAECTGCEARTNGRCEGISADLLDASLKSGGKWQGWATWADARSAADEIPEPKDTVEQLELRLGLRDVWQRELLPDAAAALAANPPAGLQAVMGDLLTAEGANPFDIEAEKPEQRLVFLARSSEQAVAANESFVASLDPDEELSNQAHGQLGKAFGYPTCCIESYVAALPARIADEYQGVSPLAFAALQAARDSQAFDARLDFASPLQDAFLPTFRPCRYDCAETIVRVEALEAELAQSAPGRLASLRKTRAQAALVFADGTEIPLTGKVRADGSLEGAQALGLAEASDSPRAKAARAAWASIEGAVKAGTALIATNPIDGLGGVTIVGKDGSYTALEAPDVAQHAEFPRLIVFNT